MAALVGARAGAASQTATTASSEQKEEDAQLSAVFVSGNMPSEFRPRVYERAIEALKEKDAEKDVATIIKKGCEEEFKGMWHCIVGVEFGASLATETGFVLFFRVGLQNILVFRTLDEEKYARELPEEEEVDEEDEVDEDFDADGSGESKHE